MKNTKKNNGTTAVKVIIVIAGIVAGIANVVNGGNYISSVLYVLATLGGIWLIEKAQPAWAWFKWAFISDDTQTETEPEHEPDPETAAEAAYKAAHAAKLAASRQVKELEKLLPGLVAGSEQEAKVKRQLASARRKLTKATQEEKAAKAACKS